MTVQDGTWDRLIPRAAATMLRADFLGASTITVACTTAPVDLPAALTRTDDSIRPRESTSDISPRMEGNTIPAEDLLAGWTLEALSPTRQPDSSDSPNEEAFLPTHPACLSAEEDSYSASQAVASLPTMGYRRASLTAASSRLEEVPHRHSA